MALDFVAGCLGGCAGVLVGHPFDTVKVLLQTQDPRKPRYKGTLHCMRSIIRRDGVAGLYRGLSAPLGGVALVNAVVFGVYGNVQRRLTDPDALSAHALAGAAAGGAQSFFCSPIELAKIRAQAAGGGGGGGGGPAAVRVLLDAARRRGPRGLFRGLAATAARDSLGVAVYFATFEGLSRALAPAPAQRLPTAAVLLAGGLAGTASWLSSFPVDVIKTRLQADGSDGRAFRYQGFWDCGRQSVRNEGVACLGRGLASTLLRAFPVNAATFAVVTWVFRLAGDAGRDPSPVGGGGGDALGGGGGYRAAAVAVLARREDQLRLLGRQRLQLPAAAAAGGCWLAAGAAPEAGVEEQPDTRSSRPSTVPQTVSEDSARRETRKKLKD